MDLLMQARNDARLIVQEKMAATIAYCNTPTTPMEGDQATILEWRAWLRHTGTTCPHPTELAWLTRGRRGGCLVCGRCYHTTILRGEYDFGGPRETASCNDCGESRRLYEW